MESAMVGQILNMTARTIYADPKKGLVYVQVRAETEDP
jgi:hypothetical protein